MNRRASARGKGDQPPQTAMGQVPGEVVAAVGTSVVARDQTVGLAEAHEEGFGARRAGLQREGRRRGGRW